MPSGGRTSLDSEPPEGIKTAAASGGSAQIACFRFKKSPSRRPFSDFILELLFPESPHFVHIL